jgi:hypothetical protein
VDHKSRSLENELAWVVAHPGSARSWAESRRISALSMVTTFVLGLLVHVVGFALGTGGIEVPAGVPADLLATLVSNLGIVLWTSVILVVFLEVLPARARRRATHSMALAASRLREAGLPVPAELADAERGAAGERPDRDPALNSIVERLASIERLLAETPVPGPPAVSGPQPADPRAK